MKKVLHKILVFNFLILTVTVFSQSINADSLENILNKKTGVERIEILNIISKELTVSNLEKSREYAEEALKLSLELKNEKEEATSYYNLAEINSRQRDYDKAIEYNDKSYKIRKAINEKEGLSQCYNLYGIINKLKGKTEEAISYFQKSIETSQSINELKVQSQAYNNIGSIYQNTGDYNRAIGFFKKAQALKENINDNKGNGISLLSIGNCYLLISDFENATTYFSKAIKIFEQIDYKPGIAKCLSSFGMINENWVKNEKAREYYEQALNIYIEIGDKPGIAEIYNNIGNAYAKDSIYEKAQEYYFKSLEANKEIGNKLMIGKLYMNLGYNLGFNLSEQNKSDEAFEYLDNALTIFKELNTPYDIVNCLAAFGKNYLILKKFDKAKYYTEQSLNMAIENNLSSMILADYEVLSDIYSQLGDYKNAFDAYTKFHATDKMIFNAESDKVFKEMQTKYETDKKQKEIELLNKDKEINESKIKQQNLIIYGFLVGFLIILAFIFLINRQYRQKKRAFIELEVKNKLITQQKLEITDSIHYAERIQRAVLPQTNFINTYFPEHFVLFKPKDIVSGDFYWMSNKDNTVIIAAADCTGHGVPGAFMSMLGVSFLNEIVNDKGITQANLILNELRNCIIRALQQTGKEGEQKDGMDISLLAINKTSDNINAQWSGANNPLYLLRNGEITEFKGNKMPVAIHVRMDSFTNNDIPLQAGDLLYIFTDGFADQFGGPQGKKFKYKPLKELLIENNKHSLSKQKDVLDKTFKAWKSHENQDGKDFEQVDDVLVIGLKV